MADQQSKVKGVVDIVFLIDVTGSMQPCIDALKQNIATFVDTLVTKDAQNPSPVKDWRARAVGYRDVICDAQWFIDNPFVRSAEELRAQLAGLHADGGGDEPESLLDALYKVSTVGQTEKGAQALDPFQWRYRSDAARVVVIFTDATYHPTMSLPEARNGTFEDIKNAVQSNRIVLSIFAPELPCYDLELSTLDKSEWESISAPGMTPQQALAIYTSNQENFRQTMQQLAKSVSKSAEVPEL